MSTTIPQPAAAKRSILIMLDTDPHPSAFDRVVAVDAGADVVFSYGGVTPSDVEKLVHGAIFTRGPKDLSRTAIFVGGSDVMAGEAVMKAARKAMVPQYGLRVSVMLDSNGANTTAAAAVRAAGRHLKLSETDALVLGGTGPVGQRVALLLARQGANVRVGSRDQGRAESVCRAVRDVDPDARLQAVSTARSADALPALQGCELVVAAGAAGTVLLPLSARQKADALEVVIDLNAVPPAGVEGVQPGDAGTDRDGVSAYGALGVGGLKMKIHRAAVGRLFERNDQVLDAEEIYALAEGL